MSKKYKYRLAAIAAIFASIFIGAMLHNLYAALGLFVGLELAVWAMYRIARTVDALIDAGAQVGRDDW